MKIAIIGSGAMGSLYGGLLAESGQEVYFVDVFKEHIDKVNKDGLTIIQDDGEKNIDNIKGVVDSKEIDSKMDLVIVFVKSTLTDIAIKGNLSIIGENTSILTLQNGLGNIEKISKYLNEDQIVVGTSANGASFIEPGKIRQAGKGGTVLGEISGEPTDRIKKIHNILNLKELGRAEIADNIMSLIWEKLIVNCGINPLTALTGLKNGELLEDQKSLRIMEEIAMEAINVAKDLDIELSFQDASYIKEVARETANNTSSMLADVQNKRKSEILNINGAIVRIGKERGLDVGVNEILTDLILLKEKTY